MVKMGQLQPRWCCVYQILNSISEHKYHHYIKVFINEPITHEEFLYLYWIERPHRKISLFPVTWYFRRRYARAIFIFFYSPNGQIWKLWILWLFQGDRGGQAQKSHVKLIWKISLQGNKCILQNFKIFSKVITFWVSRIS